MTTVSSSKPKLEWVRARQPIGLETLLGPMMADVEVLSDASRAALGLKGTAPVIRPESEQLVLCRQILDFLADVRAGTETMSGSDGGYIQNTLGLKSSEILEAVGRTKGRWSQIVTNDEVLSGPVLAALVALLSERSSRIIETSLRALNSEAIAEDKKIHTAFAVRNDGHRFVDPKAFKPDFKRRMPVATCFYSKEAGSTGEEGIWKARA